MPFYYTFFELIVVILVSFFYFYTLLSGKNPADLILIGYLSITLPLNFKALLTLLWFLNLWMMNRLRQGQCPSFFLLILLAQHGQKIFGCKLSLPPSARQLKQTLKSLNFRLLYHTLYNIYYKITNIYTKFVN